MMAQVLPLVRPVLVTGAVWLFAASAHVLGGGTLPATDTSTALIALVLLAAVMVRGRQWSLGGIAAVVGIGQVLLHQAFSLLSHETSCMTSPQGYRHHAVPAGICLTGTPESLMHADPGPAMSLVHVLAAAVTAALLSRAEAALWRLASWFHRLTQTLQPAMLFWWGPLAVACGLGPVPTPWRNHRADGIRGPPVQCAPFTSPI